MTALGVNRLAIAAPLTRGSAVLLGVSKQSYAVPKSAWARRAAFSEARRQSKFSAASPPGDPTARNATSTVLARLWPDLPAI